MEVVLSDAHDVGASSTNLFFLSFVPLTSSFASEVAFKSPLLIISEVIVTVCFLWQIFCSTCYMIKNK